MFAECHPVVRQNVHLLIPSGFAALTHLPLVTKGRLWLSKQAKTPAFAGASQTFYIPKYSRFALLLAMAYHTSTASTTPSSTRLCHRFINGVSSTELLSTCKMP